MLTYVDQYAHSWFATKGYIKIAFQGKHMTSLFKTLINMLNITGTHCQEKDQLVTRKNLTQVPGRRR